MRPGIPRCVRPQFAQFGGEFLEFGGVFFTVWIASGNLSLMTTQGGGGVALLCLLVFVLVTLNPCL